MISRQTSLSKNIVQFCRFLRQQNFTVGTEEEIAVLKALQFIDYSNNQVFRLALQAVLCRSRAQIDAFESLFDQYWKELAKAVESKVKSSEEPPAKPAKEPAFKSLQSWLHSNQNKEVEQMALYSHHESLSQKDFSLVPADELDELMRTIKALSKRLAAQANRRYKQANKPDLPDLRRTLRKNLRRGGELLEIAFRKPKRNRTRLVVLCDVSKSMELYATFLLQFMYSFQQVYSRMETFVFGTSLQYISPLLKQNDFSQAMQLISAQGDSWSSGTRIGESLNSFVKEHASRVLNKRTIVIVLSDGWDTGDVELLRQSMETIKAVSRKVIWLNPLAGFTNYRPETAGMLAALPYIDVLAPVHNADSLRRLSRWI